MRKMKPKDEVRSPSPARLQVETLHVLPQAAEGQGSPAQDCQGHLSWRGREDPSQRPWEEPALQTPWSQISASRTLGELCGPFLDSPRTLAHPQSPSVSGEYGVRVP